jgi:hypothetical protein
MLRQFEYEADFLTVDGKTGIREHESDGGKLDREAVD